MSKPIRFCKDCKWARPGRPGYYLYCTHPRVVATWPRALARSEPTVDADDERPRWSPFAPCGVRGKLWEPKEEK